MKVKIYTTKIASGNEGGSIGWEKPARFDQIERNMKLVPGASEPAFNEGEGTIDVTYSGPYDGIGEVEKAVQRSGTKGALISPAIVKFRPYALNDPDALTAALKGVPGVVELTRDAGNFCMYVPAESINLKAIDDAAKACGHPGTISSHDEYELTCEIGPNANTTKLIRELKATKFVLRAKLEDTTLKTLVVRGRCSKTMVKNVAESCGVTIAKK